MTDVSASLAGRFAGIAGTLAAWMEKELGQPPKPGQVLRRDDVEFMVRRVRRGRIFEASATIKA
jgi:hypothetical protein